MRICMCANCTFTVHEAVADAEPCTSQKCTAVQSCACELLADIHIINYNDYIYTVKMKLDRLLRLCYDHAAIHFIPHPFAAPASTANATVANVMNVSNAHP